LFYTKREGEMLEIWFRGDLQNLLLAVQEASEQAGGGSEYRRGFEDAIKALALAFGVQLPDRRPWRVQRPAQITEGRGYD
jgi:hypothetical protein